MPDETRPAPRRWLTRLAWLALLTTVAAVLLVAFAPQIVARTPLRDRALAAATKDLKGTLSVDELSLSWFDVVEAAGVTLAGEDGQVAVSIPRLATSKTLLELARDRADLGRLTVSDATVHLRCAPGTTNLEMILANYLTTDPDRPAAARPAVAVEVVNATVELSEAGNAVVQRLDAVGATVTVPAVSGAIDVTVEVAGKLHATASVGDVATAHAEATGFALEAVGPLARRFAPGADLRGTLTATADVRRAGTELDVKGKAEATDFRVAGPWLREPVALKTLVVKPSEVSYKGGELRVTGFEATCDAGNVTAAGAVNLSGDPEDALNRTGLKLHADLDLARLAAIAPKLLRLQAGTALHEGKVSLRLDSAASASHPGSVEWVGGLTTTALRGSRGGKELAWEKPLSTAFTARFDKKLRPTFDKLQCESDFIGLAGRGSAESFLVMANVDLTRLAERLGDFVDLRGSRFGGTAAVSLKNEPRPGGGFTTAGSATLKNGHFTDAAGREIAEPDVAVTLTASGKLAPDHTLRLDAGDLTVVAGGDRLSAKLLDPVADVRAARTGRLDVRLAGDLARWRGRAAPWAGLPADWQLGGTGDLAGTVAATDTGLTLTGGRADVADARFLGMGLDLREPKLKLVAAGGTWTRSSGDITLTQVAAHCETFALTTPHVDVRANGAVAANANVTANVNRVQRTLKLQSDPANSDAVNGLAIGTLALTADGPAVRFDADFKVTDVMLGVPAKPTWREPWVKVRAKGRYGDDRVTLDSGTLERDGLSADAAGSLDRLATTMDLAVKGTVNYDLAKLEPQLRQYLGAGGRVVGSGSKPFELAGPLNGPDGALVALTGFAGVSWQQLTAHGFDIGPGELRAKLERGVVTTNPVEATFGGGKVRVEPTITLTPATVLSVAPGRVVDRAKLTPAALANAVGYALPAFAGSTQADGLFSFDVTDSRIPASDPERGTVRGDLTVHAASVSPGPIVTEIAKLLGAKETTLTQKGEQVVPVRLENGRVHHEKFTVLIGQSEVHSSGSVGLDKSLAIVLDMPIPPKLLDQYLGNNPRLREALGKQRVAVPVGGTMAKPVLDAAKLNASIAALVRNAGKEAATGAATDAVKKLEGQLRDELFKKLGKPPQ